MIGESGKESNPIPNADTIILLDSSINIGELKEVLQNKQEIISFDFESHKILSKNNIEHQVSDEYLDREDLKIIQKSSYVLSKWFTKPLITDLVEYDGINLGSLLEVEFNYFLVPFLKKFAELAKICKKYNNSEFMATPNISRVIKVFTQSVYEIKQDVIQQNRTYFDTIKYDFKVGKKYYTIRLPETYYKKIKSTSEFLLHSLFGLKGKDSNTRNKTVLLAEFNPIRYQKIFSTSHMASVNTVLYCRRRPSIWNLESYSVIRRSKCQLATAYGISDKTIKKSINDGIRLIESKIDSLTEKEDFFNEFFSFGGLSFWEIIKSKFMEMLRKRISSYIIEIELAKRLLTRYKFSSILVLSEIGSTEQIIIQLAKRLRIPVVLLQHGYFFDTREAFDMNLFQGVFPSTSDKYIVWGNLEKKHLLSYGLDPQKIEVLGSPLYDTIFDSGRKQPRSDFILLATSSPVKEDVHDLIVKTNENYEECIKKICKTVSNMKKKLVIKLHPSPDELDVTKLANEIDPKIMVVKGGNILPFLKSCELLVVIDASTVILEAQLHKRPVISVSVKDYGWGNPSIVSSNSCVTTKIENFESVLRKLLTDEEFKQKIISNGTKFADDYLSNQGNASKNILDFLSKL